jgi:hypothetical protein
MTNEVLSHSRGFIRVLGNKHLLYPEYSGNHPFTFRCGVTPRGPARAIFFFVARLAVTA